MELNVVDEYDSNPALPRSVLIDAYLVPIIAALVLGTHMVSHYHVLIAGCEVNVSKDVMRGWLHFSKRQEKLGPNQKSEE